MAKVKKESGRTLGQKNVEAFESFIKRMKDDEWAPLINKSGTKIVRRKLREACGIGENPFKQNENLKNRLKQLEQDLCQQGILSTEEDKKREEAELALTKSEMAARISSRFDNVKTTTNSTVQLIQQTEEKMYRIISSDSIEGE